MDSLPESTIMQRVQTMAKSRVEWDSAQGSGLRRVWVMNVCEVKTIAVKQWNVVMIFANLVRLKRLQHLDIDWRLV